jgi:hypothetical protein
MSHEPSKRQRTPSAAALRITTAAAAAAAASPKRQRRNAPRAAAAAPHQEEEEEEVDEEAGNATLDPQVYYQVWSGHTVEQLTVVRDGLLAQGKTRFIYFAGGSSTDNKRWLFRPQGWNNAQREHTHEVPTRYQIPADCLVPAVNGMEHVLKPAQSVPDVCHWLNFELAQAGEDSNDMAAIMTSVEESLLRNRSGTKLLPQDAFIRDHIAADDVLVVSVGGNDVALSPTDEVRALMTELGMMAMAAAAMGKPRAAGPLVSAAKLAPLVDLLHKQLQAYIVKLVRQTRPSLVLVCGIYFPCEVAGPSWAREFFIAYDANPSFFQAMISLLFEQAVSKVRVPGVGRVVHVPLYEVLDPKDATHYVQRVEPSSVGGRLMAQRFLAEIQAAQQ